MPRLSAFVALLPALLWALAQPSPEPADPATCLGTGEPNHAVMQAAVADMGVAADRRLPLGIDTFNRAFDQLAAEVPPVALASAHSMPLSTLHYLTLSRTAALYGDDEASAYAALGGITTDEFAAALDDALKACGVPVEGD